MDRQAAARIAGTLFVIADVAGVGGAVLLSHQDEPDYLANAAELSSRTVTGAVLVFTMAVAVATIPAVLFPLLKKQNEALALGYGALRTIEAVILLVSAISPLVLLTLSREYAEAAPADIALVKPVADILNKADLWAGPFSQLAWSLSVMVLMYLLYRSNAVPRFIAVWGLIGAPLYLANQLLTMYNPESPTSTSAVVVTVQFAVNEFVLAIWLLVKGIRPHSSVTSRPVTATDRRVPGL